MSKQRQVSNMQNSRRFTYGISAIILVVALISFHRIIINYPKSHQEKSLNAKLKKAKPGPDQRPSDWAWLQRTFPYWKADPVAYRKEIQKAQQMRKTSSQSTSQVELTLLEFAGPTNIGGRISDIEFNPQDPSIVYAGAATGGVFKSLDMGNSWFPIFDEQANLTIGDIAVDPVNSNTVYVGTGEANGGHNNFPGGGVYKSLDGGATWQFMGLEKTVSIGRIIIDPANPQRVFVAAVGSYFSPNPERGIYRSDNGGLSWEKKLFVSDSTGAIDVVIDPKNPSRLMAAMWERVRRPNDVHLYGRTSGLYRSLDGGDNWEYLDLANGLPDPQSTNVGRIGLAISQSQPDTVYSLYTDGSGYLGTFKSFDFGTSWIDADPDKEVRNGTANQPFSWYFGQIRVHPTNPNIVYAMDVSFMRSTNGGDSWPIMYGYSSSQPSLHVDHHALAFHPANPDYIVEGNDGGINISTDGGVTWSKVADLPVTQFYEIGLDYNNSQRLYGGTQDNGTMRTLTGALNDWNIIYEGDGFYVIVDPTNSDIIYAEYQFGGLAKSTNGGSSFSPARNGINLQEPTNWSTPVVMDPHNHLTLYYGTDRIYRTTNGAISWATISPDLTDGLPGTRLGTVTTIAVSPVDSSVIWAGTDDSHVWISTDWGTNWTEVSQTLPYRWVTRVVPDPQDRNIAYVTFSGIKWVDPQPHIFRTEDQGQNWTDISSNLPDAPVNAFAVDPFNTQYLFAGTDLGAYLSSNLGNSWEYLSPALPLVSVYDMKIHPTAHYLAIGTHARSMYKMDLSFITGIENDRLATNIFSFKLEQNYPNPFNPSTTIEFTLLRTSEVALKVFNMLGEEITTLASGRLNAGKYIFQFDGSHLASGVYLYRLQVEDYIKSKKMVLMK
jgi:photosystem II stability/assembly factor-like uncharacterized protein